MNAVKVGQVWQDKDKRRNTRIEILAVGEAVDTAIGLVVGTEQERTYEISRLVKRWELVKDVSDEVTLSDAAEKVRNGKGELALKAGDTSWIVAVPERTRAKQPVYQLKVVCQVNEDYKVRLTRKMIEEFGLPICPCHKLEMEEV